MLKARIFFQVLLYIHLFFTLATVAIGSEWSKGSSPSSNLGYGKLSNPHNNLSKPDEFIAYKEYFLGLASVTNPQSRFLAESPKFVSVYTPKINGFQAGVSYVPDFSNIEAANIGHISSSAITQTATGVNNNFFKIDKNVQKAFFGSISYEHNFHDALGVKVLASGGYEQWTEPLFGINDETTVHARKLSDLKTYNVGAIISLGQFQYAASYGNSMRGLTSNLYNQGDKNIVYYNGALSYMSGLHNTSIAYFRSLRLKNTVDAVTLGSDYQIIPGLQPYAEFTYFQTKGYNALYPYASKKKFRGTVGLIGLKLKL